MPLFEQIQLRFPVNKSYTHNNNTLEYNYLKLSFFNKFSAFFDACCNSQSDCVDSNGYCQASGQCHGFGYGHKSYCSSSTWRDPDLSSSYCVSSCDFTTVDDGVAWAVGGEVAANNCCGDDNGEYLKTSATGHKRCCNSATDVVLCYGSTTTCSCCASSATGVDSGGNCITCGTSGATCSSDGDCCSTYKCYTTTPSGGSFTPGRCCLSSQYWEPSRGQCISQPAGCYDPSVSSYCNYLPFTSSWWNDPQCIPYSSQACCDYWAEGDIYLYEDIIYY